MSTFERIDIKRRWSVPSGVKLILLLAIILGFWLRSCWRKNQLNDVLISGVEITEITPANIDVAYFVENPNSIALNKSFIIKVLTASGEEFASKITQNEIPAKSKKRYLKMLQKFNMPFPGEDKIAKATVEIYITEGF